MQRTSTPFSSFMPHATLALLVLGALAFSRPAAAQNSSPPTEFETNGPVDDTGFHLAASMGVSKFLSGGATAFGLSVFPGYAIGNGLVLEGELGVHAGGNAIGGVRFNGNGEIVSLRGGSTVYAPFLFGARYKMDFGVIRAFAASHIGPSYVRGSCGSSCSSARFAIDLGTGAEYALSDTIGVGAAFTYHAMPGTGGAIHMLNFGAHASFQF